MSLRSLAAALFLGLCTHTVSAQCANNNTLSGGTINVPCPGSVSGGNIAGGRYARVSVVAGNIYTFSTCTATWNTYITLRRDTGGAVEGFNDNACNGNRAAVQWTATFTGLLRVLLDVGAACGSTGTTAPLWITCSLNDDPCSATLLPVNAACANTVGTNVGATPTAGIADPTCSDYRGGDVWFSFVAPANGQVTLTTSTVGGSSLTDGAMAVYSAAACSGALTEMVCLDDIPGNLMPRIALSGLTGGTIYYVRFFEYQNNAFGAFNICATTPPAVANDNPCSATSLAVGTSCTNTTGTTAGATNTPGVPAPTCGNYAGGDVWFSAVAPASGNLALITSAIAGSALTDGAMAVYAATACGAAMTEVACSDNTGGGNMPTLGLNGLTPGATYYIRFWSAGNTAFGTFNICAVEPIANDEPCGAIALPVDASCNLVSYTNVGGTHSGAIPTPGCGGFTGTSVDVWFSFVAPASGIAIIQSTAGTLTDGSMALYTSTSCAPAGLSLLQCSDDEGAGDMPFLRFADLIPGDTYYLRYWGSGSATGTFNLCVWSPALPATDCAYFLEMYDANENGWGSSAVQVQINGGAITNYTVTGFYNNAVIGLNANDLLQVTYVNTGPNQGQNRYQLRQVPGGFGVLQAGPSPAAGIVLLEMVDCIPPDPPKEDCRGASNICGSQTFSDNPAGTGFDVDLRVTTFGCLSAAERQGTWYKFSMASGGTVGMTITPADLGDDYDFALWGPDASVSCPPYRQPTRCSWSGTTGETGLRAAATDTTEGSGGDKWVAPLATETGDIYILYISNYSQSGLSFGLSWQLSGGASLDCVLLPVDFIGLDAVLLNDAIEVQWTTASEVDASHYIVERSTDAFVYTPLGTVQAMGNTTNLTRYTFVDDAPEEGLNYYRVQQVDLDGTTTTSPADYAIYRKATTEMVVFPNPAGDILFASFEMPEDDAVIWRILDANGRLLEQDLYQGTKGNMLIDVPLERLATGSYTLLVNDSRGKMNRSARFVKY